MSIIRPYIEFMQFVVEYQFHRSGIDIRDERGAVSTEMAVVIAAMVAIAVAASAIFISKAVSNANNIPDSVPTPG